MHDFRSCRMNLILSIACIIRVTTVSVSQTVWRRITGRLAIMNWKGCGRKQLQPNLRQYSGIHMKELQKFSENLSLNRYLRPSFKPEVSRIQVGSFTACAKCLGSIVTILSEYIPPKTVFIHVYYHIYYHSRLHKRMQTTNCSQLCQQR